MTATATTVDTIHAPAPAFSSHILDELLPGRTIAISPAKRVFDIVLASLLLLITAPFLALVAVLIKLDSPGPVFYRSRRIGRDGEPFEMIKFRTMVNRADEQREQLRALNEAPEGLFKVTDDPRLTRMGRLLRPAYLDELTQLFHVLSGQMSLVGPRPLVEDESSRIPRYSPRFSAKPGITGPWQLAGSWRVSIEEMVDLDIAYLESWSVTTDLRLLARTAACALRRSGA